MNYSLNRCRFCGDANLRDQFFFLSHTKNIVSTSRDLFSPTHHRRMAKRKRARASTADTDSSWVATNGQGASHYYQHRDSKNPRIQKHHHQHGGNDNGGGNGNGQLRPPEDLPRELHRFWYRRYQLFSRFDEGIRLSADMWFSVTPESIAR